MSDMTTVMIVEDEPAILRIVAVVLREMGFDTVTAQDGETADRMLQTVRPDCVIADVRLPGIDGVELTRRIKSNHELRLTPVMLMSAFGEPASHEGDAFIPKPFDIDDLAARVTDCLRRSVDA